MAYEQERAERDFRQNPPASAPGQGSDDDWGDIEIGSSSAESMEEVNVAPDINTTLNQQPTQQNPAQAQQDPFGASPAELLAVEALKVSGKGIGKYLKFLVESLRNNTEKDWHDLGIQITLMSAGFFILSVVIGIYHGISHMGKDSWDLALGSAIALLPGLYLMGTKSGKGGEESPKSADLDLNIPESYSEPEPEPEEFSYEDLVEEEYEECEEEVWEEPESEGSAWDNLLSEDDDYNSFAEEETGKCVDSEDFNPEEEVETLPEITVGTYTRQYLFETFCKILPKVTPNFADMVEIDDESDLFYEFETYLRGAAEQVGTKDDNIPELQKVEENVFIYRLTCTRPVGIKEQLIADEIAKAYALDDHHMIERIGVYCTVETAIGLYIINLFKGMYRDEKRRKNIVISLGDIYSRESDYVLDSSVQMPFIWGVNEFGRPWVCDLLDNNSIIISGEPRGGKSWKGQSILAQLCMFNSPKEVEFYIFDGKDKASDYRHMSTVVPHIRYFCGNQDKIIEGIEKLLEKAERERGKILSDSGYINIKDYNKDHPMDKIPYMYIVIDEMMGLMEYFNTNGMKDEISKLKGLLSIMVSKLAYAGVRFILFPHRIVDSVISKNTYSLVSCRAVVCQPNFDILKSALDITKKTFPYDIVQKGDMALKTKEVENGNVVFCHAEILTASNETNKKLFDYIGAVWGRLEPEYKPITIHGSIGGSVSSSVEFGESVVNAEPIDHTQGRETYQYEGFNQGKLVEEELEGFDGSDLDDEERELLGEETEVDESFWGKYNAEEGW